MERSYVDRGFNGWVLIPLLSSEWSAVPSPHAPTKISGEVLETRVASPPPSATEPNPVSCRKHFDGNRVRVDPLGALTHGVYNIATCTCGKNCRQSALVTL